MFDGDIYYKPSVTGKPLRLTTTEPDQNVVNGLSDWTYEGRTSSSVTLKSAQTIQVGSCNHEKQNRPFVILTFKRATVTVF